MSLVVAVAVDAAFEQRVRVAAAAALHRQRAALGRVPRRRRRDVKAMADRAPAVVILGPEPRRGDRLRTGPPLRPLLPDHLRAGRRRTGPRHLAAGTGRRGPRGHHPRRHRRRTAHPTSTGPSRSPASGRRPEAPAPRPTRSLPGDHRGLAEGGQRQDHRQHQPGGGPGDPGPRPDVVLIDLDLQFGDVAYALGLTPQHTMADAVSALDDLDATTLKVFLTRHQSGLYALCAPDEPADGEMHLRRRHHRRHPPDRLRVPLRGDRHRRRPRGAHPGRPGAVHRHGADLRHGRAQRAQPAQGPRRPRPARHDDADPALRAQPGRLPGGAEQGRGGRRRRHGHRSGDPQLPPRPRVPQPGQAADARQPTLAGGPAHRPTGRAPRPAPRWPARREAAGGRS